MESMTAPGEAESAGGVGEGRGCPATGVLARLLSFPLVLAAGLVVVTVLTAVNRFNDPDLWWHLKVGEIIWTTGQIPTTDTFSYTTNGHAWTAHEWLAELSIYGAYHFGGDQGLMVWLAVLASAIFVLVFVVCLRRAGDPLVAFIAGLLAWLFGTVGLAIRPHLLGYLFLVVELLLLELGGTRNRRWLWGLPVVFAVWVNCHGSYYFGMGVLGLAWLATWPLGKWRIPGGGEGDPQMRKALGLVLGASALALMANPFGYRFLLYPLDLMFRQKTNLQAVSEWQAPALLEPRTLALLAITGIWVGIHLWRRTGFRVEELELAAVALSMAMRHSRMGFVFGIVFMPMICRALPFLRTATDSSAFHVFANGMCLAASAVTVALVWPSTMVLQEQVRRTSPVGAVEFIQKSGLTGPLVNEYEFGGYLAWAHPHEKVFIDGRADIFEWSGVLNEYGDWITLGEDPTKLLDKYGARICLLSKNTRLANVMPHLRGWRQIYRDDVAVVFSREAGRRCSAVRAIWSTDSQSRFCLGLQ